MTALYAAGGAELVNTHSVPLAATSAPQASEILNGMATTDGGTLLTIPANTTAKLSISLSAAIGTASTTGTATVAIAGTGSPSPPTGATLAAIALRTNSGITNVAEAVIFNEIYLLSGTSTLTLTLHFGGVTNAAAVVNGAVIP